MDDRARGHLSPEEIEQVLWASRGAPTEQAGAAGPEWEEARQHLEVCEICRREAQLLQAGELELAKLKPLRSGLPGPACPPNSEWLRVAAGLAPTETAERWVNHAAQCDYCGPLLRQAAEEFSEELTAEEEGLLASLESAQPGWQREWAQKLSAAARPARAEPRAAPAWVRWAMGWPGWAFAALAVALVAVSVWWWSVSLRLKPPERLLAEAYTQQRPMELRIAQASHGPVRVERGAARSSLSRPPALLEAAAIIARELAAHPNDAAWIAAKARVDLLEWNHEAAISGFQQALEITPESPPLLTDLASAYFQRAEALNRPVDYGAAIELLGKALARRPDDPVARFNRAIVYERAFLYHQALQDWQHYLRVDPKGNWAAEAQQRLEALREKIKQPQSKPQAIADPAHFNQLFQERNDAPLAADARIEDYLDQAIRQWLPRAFPAGGRAGPKQSSASEARTALATLAKILRHQHRDRWLSELLATPRSHAFSWAVAALGNAVQASREGDPVEAGREAGRAARLFQEAGSEAGALRARLEGVYALQRAQRGDRCLAAARPLAAQLRGRGYTWMEIQLSLEQGACLSMVGQGGHSQRGIEAAMSAARAARYDTSYLRALGFAGSLARSRGDFIGAWASNREGLALYWEGGHPVTRVYQFYSDLAFFAESTGKWLLAVDLLQEAEKAVIVRENRSMEASARHRLATAMLMAGRRAEAEAEFATANRIFDTLPQNEATRSYRAYAAIGLAKLEAERGQLGPALERLSQARPALPQISSYIIPLQFYQALGGLKLALRQNEEAEKVLGSAIAIAEWSLQSLANDRDRISWNREAGRAYQSAVQLKLQSGDIEGALEIWEWYRAAALRSREMPPPRTAPTQPDGTPPLTSMGLDFASLEAGVPLPRLEQVRRLLPSLTEETVLTYARLPEGLAIWVFDNRGIVSRWTPGSTEGLERLAHRFAEQCADPSSDVVLLDRLGRQLYNRLIAPVEARLSPGRTLVIEPDGARGEIPMQALRDPSGHYLGERWAIVSSPGIGYRQRLRPRGVFSSGQEALVVGSPTLNAAPLGDFSAELKPLADAAREAQAVASRFERATLLTGDQATRPSVERNLPNAVVFHFAGHALAGVERVGLLLADSAGRTGRQTPAILTVNQLSAVQLRRCRLTVLSACSTEKGAEEGVLDPESLARGFLRAGVPHVIASRWNVDSAATALFMDAFYQSLVSGKAVSESLQAAAAVVRRRPATAHPYYWAAFHAFGRR